MIDATELLDLLESAQTTIASKPWGYEVIISTENFALKFIRVNEDERTSLQYHNYGDELIFIVSPDDHHGTMIGQDDQPLSKDRIVRIHPNVVHRAIGPIDMIELTTGTPGDITRLADDYGRAE